MSTIAALDPALTGAVGIDPATPISMNETREQGAEAAQTPAPAAESPAGAAPPSGDTPLQPDDAADRHKALTITRIRQSSAPTALKERFIALADTATDAAAVEACLSAVEESLPEFLQSKRAEAARPAHPAGEVFFRGNTDQITDEQAEEIAQRQLARSGLLRGQRVRVGD